MKDRILSYLGQGLKPADVASIVGCSPSYISQLLTDPDFKAQALALRTDATRETSEDKILTNKYLAIEHKLLAAMEGQMAFAELPAITRALEVVANRQEKRMARIHAPTIAQQATQVVVNLTLPSHAVPEYQINAQREVVAIDSKPIAPLSAVGVVNLFNQHKAAQQAALTQGTEF